MSLLNKTVFKILSSHYNVIYYQYNTIIIDTIIIQDLDSFYT